MYILDKTTDSSETECKGCPVDNDGRSQFSLCTGSRFQARTTVKNHHCQKQLYTVMNCAFRLSFLQSSWITCQTLLTGRGTIDDQSYHRRRMAFGPQRRVPSSLLSDSRLVLGRLRCFMLVSPPLGREGRVLNSQNGVAQVPISPSTKYL